MTRWAFLVCTLVATSGRGLCAAPLTLADVLRDVRAQHPEIRAAAAMAGADRERIPQASAWDDPVVGLQLQRNNQRDPFSYDTAELEITQSVPWSGNLARRKAVAAAEASVSEAAIRSRAFRLTADARDAFFQLRSAREQLDLVAQSDHLLAAAADFVRSQVASGSANTAALLLVERERAALRERALTFEREAADAAATLNSLRALPPQARIGDLATPPMAPEIPPLDQLERLAVSHRPEVAEAAARVQLAERTQDVAARAWRPDPQVIVKARHLEGAGRAVNDYDTGFAIAVPWANRRKYRSAEREAAKRRDAAQFDAEAVRLKTLAEVRDMWQRADTAQKNVTLFRDHLVPLAQQTASATRAGVVTGNNSLFELITAERAVVDAQTTLAANRADAERFATMLRTLAGLEEGP